MSEILKKFCALFSLTVWTIFHSEPDRSIPSLS